MIAWRTISQDPLDRFLQSFHRMKAFWVQMIDLDLFSNVSRDVAMAIGNQFCEKNGKLPSVVALAFRKGMGYRYVNVCINSVNDASVSCKNFVNFGPATSELTKLIWTSGTICQKLAYLVQYLWLYWTDFCNLFTTWKCFGCRWWICTLFSNLSRDVAMATK